ncbi:MAG: tetratricopeptide repeat protein, partial [Bacteroidetes bacterium]|nr:tetratricopeptide repeat protein [Bacteroidota bacterium]
MKLKFVTLALISLIFILNDANAQEESWYSLQDSVLYYHRIDNYESALKFAEKQLQLAEKEYGKNHENYIFSLKSIIILNLKLNRNKEAEKFFEQAKKYKGIEPTGELNNQKLYYEYLIEIYSLIDNSENITELRYKALKINQKIIESNNYSNQEDNFKLGLECIQKKEFIKANVYLHKILIEIERDIGKNSIQYHLIIGYIGLNHSELNNLDSADYYLEKSLRFFKENQILHNLDSVIYYLEKSLSKEFIDLMNAKLFIKFSIAQYIEKALESALKEYDNKNYKKALELFLSVEKPVIEKYGENSIFTGNLISEIAKCYVLLGDRDKSVAYIQKAYNIFKQFPETDKKLLSYMEKFFF